MRAVLLAVLLAFAFGAAADPIAPGWIEVVDGDTIRVEGESRSVRLVGLNAPETNRAECPAERELGNRASRRLRQIVTVGGLDLEIVPCACSRGTEGTPRCNYGRSCGVLRSRGEDIAAILIREGLAVPFVCGETRCPKTPRPWCEGER